MTTAANVKKSENGHWYAQDGTPAYTVIAKGTGLPRATTLRDARQLGLLPSVTTILRVLDKPALTAWKIEQACLAVLTSPRPAEEPIDTFVERILKTEKVQDQETEAARDRGTEIHAAIEDYFQGRTIAPDIEPWVAPAIKALMPYGELVATEKVLVGEGYTGKTDLILQAPACWWLWDFKSTKKLPDPTKGGAWSEHRLQLAAYAKAFNLANGEEYPPNTGIRKPVRTANLYISTVERGNYVICEHEDWMATYENGFAPLVRHWSWSTGYTPSSATTPTQARD